MKSEHLKPLIAARPPFVSVYLDDSRDSAEAENEIDARRRDIRRQLEGHGVAEQTIAAVEGVILHGPAPVGRRGRAVIAAGGEVLIDVHLAAPPQNTVVRASQYPYFLPMLDAWRPAYIFAAVDRLGADITVRRGDAVESETLAGEGFPVHKPNSAGWHGYGDVERSAEEAVRMNVRAVADRLTVLMDETEAEVLFVAGEVRTRSDTISALPERIAARVVPLHAGAAGHRIGELEAEDAIAAELDRRRAVAVARTDARFRAEIGRNSGLAAEGLHPVCAALRAGDVDTLIVGDPGETTVVIGSTRTMVAPDADALSELGEAPVEVARADEALPFAALSVGAPVVRAADDIALLDGAGVLLRYAAPGIVDTAGATTGSAAG